MQNPRLSQLARNETPQFVVVRRELEQCLNSKLNSSTLHTRVAPTKVLRGLLLHGSPGDIRAWPEPAESEARFRSLIASSPVPILVIDPDATVRLWNAAAEKLFGWTEAEVVGKALRIVPDDRLPECISCRATAMGGDLCSVETQCLRRDGSLVDVSLSVAPLRDKHGEVTEILAVFNDVTERKRAESLLAAERRVLELIATCAALPQVLDTLVHEAEANSNEGMLCSILLADDNGERLLHGAARRLPATYNQAIHGIRIGPNVGSCGTAAYERRPVFVCDITSDPRWTDFKDLAAMHGLGAWCSTPLLSSQGELLGTLAMYYRQPHNPGVHERRLIERATQLAAIVIERKRSEDALRQSRENLTAALTASDTGTFRWNLATGEFSEFDENLKRLFGFAPDKAVRVKQDFLYAVHPDDLPRLIPAADASCREGTDFTMEYRIILPDGKIRWLYDRAKMVRNAEGVATDLVGACTDITERKQAEQALAAREREFRTLADNMSQFAWMTDATGWIYWYNQRWFDYTGTTLQEMEGWGWQKVHHPDHVDRVVQKLRHSFDTGEPWEDTFPLRSKEGEYRWFLSRALPIRDERGRIQHWFGTNTDITERREAERRRTVMVNELNHRVKNTLATVQAIATQTLRNANVDSSVRESLESRLSRFPMRTTFSRRRAGKRPRFATSWHGRLSRMPVPSGSGCTAHRSGSPKAALAIAMGMHELATNAVKYGSLSNGTGQVAVTWGVDGPRPGTLHLQWKERGGPAVKPPSRKGFGSRLIERSLQHDLNAKAKIDYQPEGIVCTITSNLGTAPGENPKVHS